MLGDAPPQWPPVAHLVDKLKGTAVKGDVALCGEEIMGVNLEDADHICKACLEEAKKRQQS